eukprot:2657443-Pyramimonas_sp.AAC.1
MVHAHTQLGDELPTPQALPEARGPLAPPPAGLPRRGRVLLADEDRDGGGGDLLDDSGKNTRPNQTTPATQRRDEEGTAPGMSRPVPSSSM